MKTGYKVCDAMTQQPVAVTPDTSLEACARIMQEKHVGALLVKQDAAVHGIITEQDIVRKAVAGGLHVQSTLVHEVMERNIETIAPEADIFDALIKMRDLNIRHLPVVAGESMVGLLTLKDILKIQPQLFDLLVEQFELREEERKPVYQASPREGICQECGEYTRTLYSRKGALICGNCR